MYKPRQHFLYTRAACSRRYPVVPFMSPRGVSQEALRGKTAGRLSTRPWFHGAYRLITTSWQLCGSLVTRRCEEEGFCVPLG
jgi:hypothetical protein